MIESIQFEGINQNLNISLQARPVTRVRKINKLLLVIEIALMYFLIYLVLNFQ